MLTESDVEIAVARAIAFQQRVREPHALLFMGLMHRRFGVEAFADSLERYDEVLPEHPDRAPVLRVFRRMFDANNPIVPDDWDHVTNPTDRLLISALYCDRLGLPPSFADALERAVTQGGYAATHALLSWVWIRENGCKLAVRDGFLDDMVSAVAAIVDDDPTSVNDIKLEAAAFLCLARHSARVDLGFVRRVDFHWFGSTIRRMRKSAVRALACASLVLPVESALSQTERPATAPFVDVTEASNIAYRVGYTRPALLREKRAVSESTFGGAAAGDCDGDTDIDLFITYGNTNGPDGGGGPNRLYLNQLAEGGNGLQFEDFAEAGGVANTRLDGKGNDRHSGPTFADMDGDGDLDLFVGGIYDDPNKIYENDGSCRFTDVTSNSPDVENMRATHTVSAGFGDYDLDGDLDMFLTHWATQDRIYAGADGTLGESDHLWRNESDESGIRFVNVSEETEISGVTWETRAEDFYVWPQDADFTFAATFARLNDDAWPDIAIAADFGTTQVAINTGGTFLSLDNPVMKDAQFGMGSALGDYDNDGDLDWFVTSIFGPGDDEIGLYPSGNRLYTNDGSPTLFVDDTERLGVADGAWGWAACFVDIDNDADLDIYHTNGWSEPFLGHQVWQTAASRTFVMNSEGVYIDEGQSLGLAAPNSARGVVCADFDHDGDTDILELTDAETNAARLWENRTAAAGRYFLRIELEGLPPNTEAAGARILVRTGETQQMREIMIGSNFTSQNPTVQIFGLGASQVVDEILVEWPATLSDEGPVQLGTLLRGPIAPSRPGETLVIGHPSLSVP